MGKIVSTMGWPWRKLRRRLDRCTAPLPWGLWLVNVVFQRILGVNGTYPFMVHFTSRVTGSVIAGKNVWVSFAVSGGCYIQGINGIEIGDDTIFAPGVKIISANHSKHDLSKYEPSTPIRIGKRCWIGANAVILPGVELGDDVVIGAGAVVTRSFSARSVLAGVPARAAACTGSLAAARDKPEAS